MMKSWVSQLLIVLIALQSVMAVADVHLEHDSNSDHTVSDHQTASELTLHTEDTQTKASQTEDTQTKASQTEDTQTDSANSIDCNHCCHCHSPQFNFLGNLVTDPIFKDGEKHAIDLKNTTPFSLASQLFKPPRAHS